MCCIKILQKMRMKMAMKMNFKWIIFLAFIFIDFFRLITVLVSIGQKRASSNNGYIFGRQMYKMAGHPPYAKA